MADTSVNQPTERTDPDHSPAVYVGPRPYEMGQTLYGRDREAVELASLLISQRLVLLHSPSGAGKTSLIHAKIVPAMQKRRFEVPLYQTPDNRAPQPVKVRVHREPEPGDPKDSNRYVLSAVLSLELHRSEPQRRSVAELARMSLDEYLEEAFPAASLEVGESGTDAKEFRPLLLLFDQFEELVTMDPTDEQAKKEFARQLGQALQNRGRWALFSIREDYLGALEPYFTAIPTGLAATYRLDLLQAGVAATVIEEPARAAGVTFEEGVVHQLVEDLRRVRVQEPDGSFRIKGGPYVEPVQLQVVCQSLWRIRCDSTTITHEHLKKLGRGKGTGVDDVLAGYYAERVAQAASEGNVSERVVRDWFSKSLIGGQHVRRPVLVNDALAFGLTTDCLQVLDNAFLIRREIRSGAHWYELAHDRLMTPVLNDNALWRQEHLTTFQIQAEFWTDRGRPDDLLLTVGSLGEAEAAYAADCPEPLTAVEKELLEASRKARERELAERAQEKQLARVKSLRQAVAAGTLFIVLLSAVAAVAVWQWLHAERQKDIAEQAELKSSWQGYAGQVGQAHRNLADGNSLLAKQLLDATRPKQRGWEHKYLTALVEKGRRGLIGHHDASVTAVAFRVSSDGTSIVTASDDSTLRIWNATTLKHEELKHALKGHKDSVTCVAVSSDEQWIVSGSDDKTLIVWDATTRKPKHTLEGHEDSVTCVAFAPDGRWIVSGSEDSTLILWDPTNGNKLKTFRRHEGAVMCVAVSPDGKWVVSGGADTKLKLWDLNGEPTLTLAAHDGPVTSVDVSPDGKWIVSGSVDKTVKAWDPMKGPDQDPRNIGEHEDAVSSLAIRADGRRIASGSRDGVLKEWDAETLNKNLNEDLKNLMSFRAHTGVITSVAYDPQGTHDPPIVSGSTDTMVKIWDQAPARDNPNTAGHTGPVYSVAVSPDGKWIVSASEDRTLRIWGKNIGPLKGHADGVRSVAVSPNGQQIASGSEDHTVRVWNATTGAEIWTFDGHQKPVSSVVFSPDAFGKWIISGSHDGTLKLWDTILGKEIRTFQGHTDAVTSVAISPNGQQIISGSEDKTIKVWETTTGKEIRTLQGHSSAVGCVAFSPDGERVVSGSKANKLRLWDLATGEKTMILEGHTAWVTSVTFSPDGKRIVSGSEDDTIKLWELETGQVTLTLKGHYDTVWGVAFSPDGKRLVSGSEDWTLKVWDAAETQPFR